jgi:hypothetical protein
VLISNFSLIDAKSVSVIVSVVVTGNPFNEDDGHAIQFSLYRITGTYVGPEKR